MNNPRILVFTNYIALLWIVLETLLQGFVTFFKISVILLNRGKKNLHQLPAKKLTMKTTTQATENRNGWNWGFTPQTENWNGRLAMIGFLAAALIELFSGKGFLHFWGIL
jgi:hypothetical protein